MWIKRGIVIVRGAGKEKERQKEISLRCFKIYIIYLRELRCIGYAFKNWT